MGEKLGSQNALNILRNHWDTFVTWQDFNKIKQSGFNVVRIPVGYWAYDTFGSPYVSGAAVYIDAAIDWARSVGLKIVIDLHGVPGSQNGFDNSGQRMERPTWQQGDTIRRTLQVLRTISQKYAQKSYQDVIIGIQLLNEPALYNGLSRDVLAQFYRDGYGQVREVSDTPVIISDGFTAPNSWNGFLAPSDANARNVAIDNHQYQVFASDLLKLSPAGHAQQACRNTGAYGGADKWTFGMFKKMRYNELLLTCMCCSWRMDFRHDVSMTLSHNKKSTQTNCRQGLRTLLERLRPWCPLRWYLLGQP